MFFFRIFFLFDLFVFISNTQVGAGRQIDFAEVDEKNKTGALLRLLKGNNDDPNYPPVPVQRIGDVELRAAGRVAFDTTNNYRRTLNLNPLEWEDQLYGIALEHSYNMAAVRNISHTRKQ